VWRERSGRRLSEDELVVLVATRRTPVLTGFTSRKSGRGFSAALELKRKTTGAWETAFVFADREG
jgi:DNA topoisomerase-3